MKPMDKIFQVISIIVLIVAVLNLVSYVFYNIGKDKDEKKHIEQGRNEVLSEIFALYERNKDTKYEEGDTLVSITINGKTARLQPDYWK
jgi:hypothetical protein